MQLLPIVLHFLSDHPLLIIFMLALFNNEYIRTDSVHLEVRIGSLLLNIFHLLSLPCNKWSCCVYRGFVISFLLQFSFFSTTLEVFSWTSLSRHAWAVVSRDDLVIGIWREHLLVQLPRNQCLQSVATAFTLIRSSFWAAPTTLSWLRSGAFAWFVLDTFIVGPICVTGDVEEVARVGLSMVARLYLVKYSIPRLLAVMLHKWEMMSYCLRVNGVKSKFCLRRLWSACVDFEHFWISRFLWLLVHPW